jgi:hypothetical protein
MALMLIFMSAAASAAMYAVASKTSDYSVIRSALAATCAVEGAGHLENVA